ncbi:hypothetical protein H4582DRAFT_2053833 [Lactarius indigo]|nr:hypothetical protein H4582DRAFT_2053833 [Lactarius indigo]
MSITANVNYPFSLAIWCQAWASWNPGDILFRSTDLWHVVESELLFLGAVLAMALVTLLNVRKRVQLRLTKFGYNRYRTCTDLRPPPVLSYTYITQKGIESGHYAVNEYGPRIKNMDVVYEAPTPNKGCSSTLLRYRTGATYRVATFKYMSFRGAEALMPQGLGSAVITLIQAICGVTTGRGIWAGAWFKSNLEFALLQS